MSLHRLRLQCLSSCSMAPGGLSCSQNPSRRLPQAQGPTMACAGSHLACWPWSCRFPCASSECSACTAGQTSNPSTPNTATPATIHTINAPAGAADQRRNTTTPTQLTAAPDVCILHSSTGQQPTLPSGPLELPVSPSRLAWPPGERTPWWRPLAPGRCGLPRLPPPGEDSPGEPGRESSPRACPAGAMPPGGDKHQVRHGITS